MRLWSIHPSQLDRIALVAVWREGLLAKKVLEGHTKGYRSHPQLARFRNTDSPIAYISAYLHGIADEADARGYRFDRSKLQSRPENLAPVMLTNGQLAYEWSHLLSKALHRDPYHYKQIEHHNPRAHSLFLVADGGIAEWEKIK